MLKKLRLFKDKLRFAKNKFLHIHVLKHMKN